MKRLIILEIANNHAGSVDHAKSIIKTYSEICKNFLENFDFVFKFQYRDLDNFIRKDMAGNHEIPLIKRFSETRLNTNQFKEIIDFCKTNNMGTMVTPFDENSVDLLIKHNVDFVKIASCSFDDWPLLEKIAKTNKKVVASCAGADEKTIGNVVSFFENRNIFLLLQHCVGEYPTPYKNLNVGQVKYLKEKYPCIQIGFSSHEDPTSIDIAPLALALGASSFEKHIALETSQIKKNKYSTSPSEFENWLKQLEKSLFILGQIDTRYNSSSYELESLRKLQRGVFAKKNLNKGDQISLEDVYFAFPPSEGQLTANRMSKYNTFLLTSNISKDETINLSKIEIKNSRNEVLNIVKEVVSILKESKITIPKYADLEISHHYGIHRFLEYGLTMITVINREYCKKILILLPGQSHPEQYHEKKEETFHVLWGEGLLRLNNEEKIMQKGDVFVIEPGVKHFVSTKNGLILEEISSTHFKDDSYYSDSSINNNKNRKTFLKHWRFL